MFKKIWKNLDGVKTITGNIILIASLGLQAFFPELLTPAQYNFIDIVGAALSGVGLGHKAVKQIQLQTNKKQKTI